MKTVREQLHEIDDLIQAEFELMRLDPSQRTDERLYAIDDLQDRADELRTQLDAELPRLVREMSSDKVLLRILIKHMVPDLSTKEGRTVARLKEIQRSMDQAASEQLPALDEEMTGLFNELKQDYERARAARRSNVG